MTRREKRERKDAIQERIELGYTPSQAERAQTAQERLRRRCQQEVQDEDS